MNTIFGEITQPHNRTTLEKKNTRVLALLLFYQTTQNPKKSFRVLSFFIYTIFSKYVFIEYLACEQKMLSELPVNTGGDFKHKKRYDKIIGIVIPDLLIN